MPPKFKASNLPAWTKAYPNVRNLALRHPAFRHQVLFATTADDYIARLCIQDANERLPHLTAKQEAQFEAARERGDDDAA